MSPQGLRVRVQGFRFHDSGAGKAPLRKLFAEELQGSKARDGEARVFSYRITGLGFRI